MIKSFSPGSITLFFEIRDNKKDPLKIGSRGVGICISMGMVTTVEESEKIEIYLNNKRIKNSIQELVAKKHKFSGIIKSYTQLPISQGFGMSAAAALSTSLAISALKHKTYLEGAQIAHLSEIEMGSGLGDVASQYEGGATVRLKEGIQPYGIVDRIFYPDLPITLIVLDEGIETKKIIQDPTWKRKIKKEGYKAMQEFLTSPSIENAIKIGRKFSLNTSLISEEGKNLLDLCENAAISMIGNSAVIIGDCKSNIIEDYKSFHVKLGDRAKLIYE